MDVVGRGDLPQHLVFVRGAVSAIQINRAVAALVGLRDLGAIVDVRAMRSIRVLDLGDPLQDVIGIGDPTLGARIGFEDFVAIHVVAQRAGDRNPQSGVTARGQDRPAKAVELDSLLVVAAG
jgi:hypothetical protein